MPNFNTYIDRRNTACLKYDGNGIFGIADDVLPLWIADMDLPVPDAVVEAIGKRAQHPLFGYNYAGASYYQSVIDWMARTGLSVTQEEICPFPGIVPALALLYRAYLKEGEAILVQPPVYAPFSEMAERGGYRVVENRLHYADGRYTVDLEDFERKIIDNKVRVFVQCNPHNPVGRSWTEEELAAMGEICIRHDVLIIADEIHADLTHPPHKHISIAQISPQLRQRTIICTAPSKTFNMAGMKVANIIIPNQELRHEFQEQCEDFDLVSLHTFSYVACESAYNQGGEWLDQLLVHIQSNFALLDSFLKEHLPELKLIKPEATYLAWIDCNALAGTMAEINARLLEKGKLWIEPSSRFQKDLPDDKFYRINLAVPQSTLEDALDRLRKGIR